jgi:hypothetical protein
MEKDLIILVWLNVSDTLEVGHLAILLSLHNNIFKPALLLLPLVLPASTWMVPVSTWLRLSNTTNFLDFSYLIQKMSKL